jgi:hypothetical protein
MSLSRHLELDEVIKSASAIKLGVSNVPTAEHEENLRALAGAIFEPLRVNLGKPVYVSSGYRSEAVNKSLGAAAARKSQHLTGEALDLDQDGRNTGLTNREVFLWIRDNLPFDQLIWEFGDKKEPRWVHVSYRATKRRGQVLRAVKQGTATIYQPWAA